MKFKAGDIIKHKRRPEIIRQIVIARSKSYLWKYPDLPDSESNLFDSRNSSDPELIFFELK